MGKLIAKVPILLGVQTIQPGEELPETEKELVEAWKRSEACEEWEEDAVQEEPIKKTRARRKSAPDGIPVPGTEGELVGKVPDKGRKGAS